MPPLNVPAWQQEIRHRFCAHGTHFDEGCWACSDEMGLLAWMGDPDA